MKIKIRDMKDKIEMNGLIYCIGENGGFSGIFVEKEANTGSQIIESYVNGKITKKLEYKKISTNNDSYKMFLVKSIVYRKGELYQTKEYKYDNYEVLKGRKRKYDFRYCFYNNYFFNNLLAYSYYDI